MKQELKMRGFTTGLIYGVIAAFISPASSAQSTLEDCMLIKNDAERLSCFDTVMAPKDKPAREPVAAEQLPQPVEKPAPQQAPQPAPQPAPKPEAVAESQPVQAAAPAAVTTSNVLTDEIGRETVKDTRPQNLSVFGRLDRCEKGSSGRYVFYFENGQVWRQRNNVRVNWKNCSFDVTISKDAFGYTLVRAGETRKVRVERVR